MAMNLIVVTVLPLLHAVRDKSPLKTRWENEKMLVIRIVLPFIPFPHNDTFWWVWERRLLKTLWEKEKLLVQAISPFCTMFSTLSKTEVIIYVPLNLSFANAFKLVWSKISSNGNGLSKICSFLVTWNLFFKLLHLLTINNKIIDFPNLNAFADSKICVARILEFVLGCVENIVG